MIPHRGGLPHSDIHGSKPARGSPWLFAACHVLHRLLVPRHPPNALIALETTVWGLPQTTMHRSHPHLLQMDTPTPATPVSKHIQNDKTNRHHERPSHPTPLNVFASDCLAANPHRPLTGQTIAILRVSTSKPIANTVLNGIQKTRPETHQNLIYSDKEPTPHKRDAPTTRHNQTSQGGVNNHGTSKLRTSLRQRS